MAEQQAKDPGIRDAVMTGVVPMSGYQNIEWVKFPDGTEVAAVIAWTGPDYGMAATRGVTVLIRRPGELGRAK